jgi:hypothetical protein
MEAFEQRKTRRERRRTDTKETGDKGQGGRKAVGHRDQFSFSS